LEAVLRSLARFDEAGRTGLDAVAAMASVASADPVDLGDVVRAMATLSGCPARLVDPATGVTLGSDALGNVEHPDSRPHPLWIRASVLAGEEPALWIERIGPVSIVEAALLDAAAEILRSLRFSASGAPATSRDDVSLLLTVEDPNALRGSLGRLRLRSETRCRVIARPGSLAQIQVLSAGPRVVDPTAAVARGADRAPEARVGIGTVERADGLIRSWETARVALAFAADGSEEDPGTNVVAYDELGIWAQLHGDVLRRGDELDDVVLLSKVVGGSRWAASTLTAVVTHSSLRLAASSLFTHHSTVQSRMAVLERALGWNLNSPQGRLRLSMALAARRYLSHPPESGLPRSMDPAVLFGDG